MVAAPRTPDQMLALYPHVLVGRVVAVTRLARRSYREITIDDVAVTLAVRKVRKGSKSAGTEVTFHGETIVSNEGGVIGPASTVPDLLPVGTRIEVYLDERAGRLFVPEYAALIVVPPPVTRLRRLIGRLLAR